MIQIPHSQEYKKVDSYEKYLFQLYKDENIIVKATSGTENIEGSDLFSERVYLDTLPSLIGEPTQDTIACIYEVVNDGTFIDFFGSFGEDRKRWQESQVLQFCRDHRDKIRIGSYVTLFELENGCVVGVLIDDDNRLRAFIRSLNYPALWQAYYRRRLIIPF